MSNNAIFNVNENRKNYFYSLHNFIYIHERANMSVNYTVGGNQFTHQINANAIVERSSCLDKLRACFDALLNICRYLWNCYCPCLRIEDRSVNAVEPTPQTAPPPDWEERLDAMTLTQRNDLLNACHIEEEAPLVAYLDAVRQHRGVMHGDIQRAASRLSQSTNEIINDHYARITQGGRANARAAYLEAIAIQEVMMHEGIRAIPTYHPELATPAPSSHRASISTTHSGADDSHAVNIDEPPPETPLVDDQESRLDSLDSQQGGFASLGRTLRPDEELARIILTPNLDQREIQLTALYSRYHGSNLMRGDSLFGHMWRFAAASNWPRAAEIAQTMLDQATRTAVVNQPISRHETNGAIIPPVPAPAQEDEESAPVATFLDNQEQDECFLACGEEHASQTSCCNNFICLGCFSGYITADGKQGYDTWRERGQVPRCPGCNGAFNLGARENNLTPEARVLLRYFTQRYVGELYPTYSDARAVFCEEDDCYAAYNIDMRKEYFQCHNREAHTGGRITLHHVPCGLVWDFDHVCPMDRERRLREEIYQFRHVRDNIDAVKRCPRCQRYTYRDEGCNHMVCRPCGHEYCWVCEQPWHGPGYWFQCTSPEREAVLREARMREVMAELNPLEAQYRELTGHALPETGAQPQNENSRVQPQNQNAEVRPSISVSISSSDSSF